MSSSEPEPIEPYHHELSVGAYPLAKGRMWAKCDMLATVSLDRLDRIKTGKRQYGVFKMPSADMDAILAGVKAALGLH